MKLYHVLHTPWHSGEYNLRLLRWRMGGTEEMNQNNGNDCTHIGRLQAALNPEWVAELRFSMKEGYGISPSLFLLRQSHVVANKSKWICILRRLTLFNWNIVQCLLIKSFFYRKKSRWSIHKNEKIQIFKLKFLKHNFLPNIDNKDLEWNFFQLWKVL